MTILLPIYVFNGVYRHHKQLKESEAIQNKYEVFLQDLKIGDKHAASFQLYFILRRLVTVIIIFPIAPVFFQI